MQVTAPLLEHRRARPIVIEEMDDNVERATRQLPSTSGSSTSPMTNSSSRMATAGLPSPPWAESRHRRPRLGRRGGEQPAVAAAEVEHPSTRRHEEPEESNLVFVEVAVLRDPSLTLAGEAIEVRDQVAVPEPGRSGALRYIRPDPFHPATVRSAPRLSEASGVPVTASPPGAASRLSVRIAQLSERMQIDRLRNSALGARAFEEMYWLYKSTIEARRPRGR